MPTSAQRIQILIADDHRIHREGLRRLLEGETDFLVVGEAGSSAETLRLAQQLRTPNVNQTLAREGTEVSGSESPENFSAFLAEDAKLWARLVKDSGAKAE